MRSIRLNSHNYFIIILFGFLFILSCKKTASPGPNSFTWTYAGQNYKANIDSVLLFATLTDQHLILASTGTGLSSLEANITIVTSTIRVGSHSVPYSVDSGPVSVIYTDDTGNTIRAKSGTINITKNTGNYLSGNFSVILENNNSLTADFLNVPIGD